MAGERDIRRRAVALVAVMLIAATFTAIARAPRAAAVLPSPFTGAFVTSDDGTRAIAAADVHVLNPTGTDGAQFSLGATDPIGIDFDGPAGGPLTPGVYAVVFSPAVPSLGLGGGVQCGGSSGE
jgi:hypothetical protein